MPKLKLLTTDQTETLETLLANVTIGAVLKEIALHCETKAEKVRASTQPEDEKIARRWKRAAVRLESWADSATLRSVLEEGAL